MVDWLKEREGAEEAFKELSRIHCDDNSICADLAWQGFLRGSNARANKKAMAETLEGARAAGMERIASLYNIENPIEDKFAK